MSKYRGIRSIQAAVALLFGIFGYTLAVPCDKNTWFQLPSTSIVTPVKVLSNNLSDCQSICIANNNCSGVSWNVSNSNCSLNLAPANATNSGINYQPSSIFYYGLIRNYFSCNLDDYNCTFFWNVSKEFHGFGAKDIPAKTLIECVQACQSNILCLSVDWNYEDSSCWIFYNGTNIANIPHIVHFEKLCTGRGSTTAPTTKPTTPGASTISTTTTTTTTTTPPTTSTTTASITPKGLSPPAAEAIGYDSGDLYRNYPMAIKPTYIVLAGIGGGCLLLVITAVVILCEYSLRRSDQYSTNNTVTRVQTDQSSHNNDYMDSNGPEDVSMNEVVETEPEEKQYYNSDEID